jgi:hypothetical protein
VQAYNASVSSLQLLLYFPGNKNNVSEVTAENERGQKYDETCK